MANSFIVVQHTVQQIYNEPVSGVWAIMAIIIGLCARTILHIVHRQQACCLFPVDFVVPVNR